MPILKSRNCDCTYNNDYEYYNITSSVLRKIQDIIKTKLKLTAANSLIENVEKNEFHAEKLNPCIRGGN